MTVINTNTSSMIARDAIQRNDRAMATAMERLSTGSRINSAKDDSSRPCYQGKDVFASQRP